MGAAASAPRAPFRPSRPPAPARPPAQPAAAGSILPWLRAHPRADKQTWGGVTWGHLHRRAIAWRPGPPGRPAAEARAAEMTYLRQVFEALPCPDCRTHALSYFLQNPPPLDTSLSYQNWVWEFHNSVNARLGAPIYTYRQYQAHYETALLRAQQM